MTSVILCTSEHARLSELEKAISKGQKQFVAVGLALIVALYRKRQTAHVEDLTTLKL